MTTRRYGDDEVREIFSLATTGQGHDATLPVESSGLTLDELQRIGEEAGIERDRVAEAAASLDARGREGTVKRALGLPIGVSRVVDLPRAPTDREWEQLISAFRTEFGSQGQVTTTGGLREWSNGNLSVSVEPTERGEQLRLSTLNGGAMVLNAAAVFLGIMAALMGTVVTAAGKPDKAIIVVGMFGGMGLTAFAANVLLLPRWARERKQQMEALAQRAFRLLSRPER